MNLHKTSMYTSRRPLIPPEQLSNYLVGFNPTPTGLHLCSNDIWVGCGTQSYSYWHGLRVIYVNNGGKRLDLYGRSAQPSGKSKECIWRKAFASHYRIDAVYLAHAYIHPGSELPIIIYSLRTDLHTSTNPSTSLVRFSDLEPRLLVSCFAICNLSQLSQYGFGSVSWL
jgi:hypothetical protein